MPGTAERFRISGKSGSEFPEPTICKEIGAFARQTTIRRTSFGVRWMRNHLQRVGIFLQYPAGVLALRTSDHLHGPERD